MTTRFWSVSVMPRKVLHARGGWGTCQAGPLPSATAGHLAVLRWVSQVQWMVGQTALLLRD